MEQKKQRHKLWIRIVAAPFCLVLALAFLYVLERLADINQDPDPASKVQLMIKDQYNEYGLENHLPLSTEPLEEKDGVIRYSDRWLSRFKGDEASTRRAQEIVSSIRTQYPSVRSFYVLPIPIRIVTEEGYEQERNKYLSYMEHFKETFDGTAQVVDVLPELEARKGQYLFFRTEESWTARGAYYGSRVLCEMLGIEPFTLEAYEEHMYGSFRGSLYNINQLTAAESEGFPDDPVFYYLLPGSKNRETLLNEKGLVFQRPVFTPSAKGMDTFVGTGPYAVLEGDAKNEETQDAAVLLICDSNGRLLAPFLANYYEKVFVVQIQQYESLHGDFPGIMADYGIEDIVWAQSSQNLGSAAYSRALDSFLTEQ